jgi:hypothetical protein
MLSGSCHCGSVRWTLEGAPDSATACNCTLCRRYGALWAYGFENETIRVSGTTTSYVRRDFAEPYLEIRFCPKCAAVAAWRGLRTSAGGRRRMAVNLRLAPPEAVAALTIERHDGLDTGEDLPGGGRCVADLWF